MGVDNGKKGTLSREKKELNERKQGSSEGGGEMRSALKKKGGGEKRILHKRKLREVCIWYRLGRPMEVYAHEGLWKDKGGPAPDFRRRLIGGCRDRGEA